jgi:flagellar biosynthesis protein FliP
MKMSLRCAAFGAAALLAVAPSATAQMHSLPPGVETYQFGAHNRLPAAVAAATGAPIPAGASAPSAAVPKGRGNTSSASAEPTGPVSSSLHLNPTGGPTGIQLQGVPGGTVPWSIVILLTGLTLIPALLLCVTPFARLLIVFHFLRQALGLQTTPSNQTLIGLSLILTFFLMQPVGAQIYDTAIVPMQDGQITATVALERSEGPLRKFMVHYVREKDVALFVDLAREPRPASIDDVSMRVLLPAYIVSELKAGFQIGTVLFLPFLIVDMVVASITTSVGMLQLPPVVISTPLKLLLFLMVDGWHLLIGSLMRSFS